MTFVPRETFLAVHKKLKLEIDSLPDCPGVYQYYNAAGEIIYVGKAKNLKRRVSSYFSKDHGAGKTAVLVKNIDSLKYVVVNTEEEALLLENNLIKEYQPRYNVLLKDDKSYPSIRITNEAFPRVFKTRTIVKDGSSYFGPYASVHAINYILEVIHELFPIRTCRLQLNKENVEAGRFKLCLQYHIHRCKGPCEGRESEEEYAVHIERVRQILQGDANEISKVLFKEMQDLSAAQRYEEAYKLKLKYDLVENFKSKTVVANTILNETDVFGYEENDKSAYISMLRVSKGSIVQGFTIEYRKQLHEEKEDLLAMAVVELRQRLRSNSKEIILPFPVEFPLESVKVSIPSRGERKKLLDLATQNVKQYKLDQLKQAEKLNPDQRNMQLLKQIQDCLGLEKKPTHIECFDNSNIQGQDAVAACVVYKGAKPSKKDYRKYSIKTVLGQDDYASMKEVIRRRYTRALKEEQELPNLIVADGGIGQMEVIRQVIEDELNLSIPILGLVKDVKHRTRELLIGEPPRAVGMKVNDPLFTFFAAMQEEVHRFAIKFHREKRSKSQVLSELDSIQGIGEKTKIDLIRQFKSLKRIRLASLEELQNCVGNHRGSMIYGYFRDPESL